MATLDEDADSAPDKLVGALASGLKVLRHLARSDQPMGVSQIARDLELNPSTCFNLLKTLVHERLVIFDADKKSYSLGLGFIEMARGTLEKASFVRFARPHLEQLAREFQVTATVWQRTSNDRMMLIERVDNDSTVRVHMNLGQRLPMLIAALGRCMAAHSTFSREELRRRFAELRWQDPPSFEAYLAEVDAARENGYAIDMDRYVRGVTTVSAPILGEGGAPIMALSAIGFSGQFTPVSLNALAARIRDDARDIGRTLTGEAFLHPGASAKPAAAANGPRIKRTRRSA